MHINRLGNAAALSLIVATVACSRSSSVDAATRERVTAAVEATIEAACDLSKPDVVERMMSLYPKTGPIVSAAGGSVVTSRDSLAGEINWFWNNVGINMRNPRWVWGPMHVDVLAPNAAVLTATYTIPHINPHGHLHIIGGAWTAAFQQQGGRWVIVQEHLSDAPQVGGDSMPPMQMGADSAKKPAAGRGGRPPIP